MRITFLLLSILIGSFAIGQSSVTGQNYFTKELKSYMASMLNNPSFYFFHPDSSFSDVSLQWEKDKAKGLYHIQTGNAHTTYLFHAQSLLKKKKEVLWGSAAYKNEQIEGIKWSNVADPLLVYPYIVADTIVRTSYGEHYYFNGGYAVQFNKLSIGGEAHYRSGLEYRKLDPRPKSTISDLKISMGATLPVGKQRLGLHLKYGGYKQEQIVEIYRSGGGSKMFYMRGLGALDDRYSTVITANDRPQNKYKIEQGSLGIQLFPANNKGWFATADFCYSTLKQLDTSNNIVNQLNSHQYHSELGYLLSDNLKDIRLKMYVTLKSNNGTEYNYNNSGILVSNLKKYSLDNYQVGLSGIMMFQPLEKRQWFVDMDAGYIKYDETHLISLVTAPSFQRYSVIQTKLNGGFNYRMNTSGLSAQLSTIFSYYLDKDLETSTSVAPTANETFVIPNYKYLTSKKILLSPEIRYDKDLDGSSGLYIKAIYCYEIYDIDLPFSAFHLAIGFTL